MFPLLTDLAPGDARSAELDLREFEFHRIRSVDDAMFEVAYQALWKEFGAANEMERREILALRFGLAPKMVYEIILVRRDGELAGVRDHTVIPVEGEVVVHLSHNLIAPPFRRGGLAGWMRALPIATARDVVAGVPITLVAEMEYDDGKDANRAIRLRAYEKGGFRKIDPQVVHYHQPDFRVPELIDATGGPRPLPFQLCVRHVGKEDTNFISGDRIRRLIMALYDMYGQQFRAQDMAHPALELSNYPSPSEQITLLAPTA